MSVVVASRGRAALLPRLVAAIEAQTVALDDVELVVVDDASPDDTATVLATLAREAKVALRVVALPTQQGRAAARNHGWWAARAPVVAFTDDDCVPDPEWLAAGLGAMGDAPRLVVGRTEPPEDQRALAARPFARVLEVHGVRYYETCNIFFRRRDLMAVRGFDERYRTWGGEDTDLGLRVVSTGVDARYAPAALVHHDVCPDTWAGALRALQRRVWTSDAWWPTTPRRGARCCTASCSGSAPTPRPSSLPSAWRPACADAPRSPWRRRGCTTACASRRHARGRAAGWRRSPPSSCSTWPRWPPWCAARSGTGR